MAALTHETQTLLETIRDFNAAARNVACIAKNAAAAAPKARPDARWSDEGEPDEIDYTRFTSVSHLIDYVFGDEEYDERDSMRYDDELYLSDCWKRANTPPPMLYPPPPAAARPATEPPYYR